VQQHEIATPETNVAAFALLKSAYVELQLTLKLVLELSHEILALLNFYWSMWEWYFAALHF
jgi:hypothetical protein